MPDVRRQAQRTWIFLPAPGAGRQDRVSRSLGRGEGDIPGAYQATCRILDGAAPRSTALVRGASGGLRFREHGARARRAHAVLANFLVDFEGPPDATEPCAAAGRRRSGVRPRDPVEDREEEELRTALRRFELLEEAGLRT